MNMEICPELRPCVIITDYRSETTVENAFFHRWTYEQYPVEAGLTIGSHNAGQVSHTLGIVEMLDGTVRTVLPCRIRFLDSKEKAEQIAWEKDSRDE